MKNKYLILAGIAIAGFLLYRRGRAIFAYQTPGDTIDTGGIPTIPQPGILNCIVFGPGCPGWTERESRVSGRA